MALSSTFLNKLIQEEKWQEFQHCLEEFHEPSNPYHVDVESLQKMTNLIAYSFGNEKTYQTINKKLIPKMSTSFLQAIKSFTNIDIEKAMSQKDIKHVFHYICIVIKRLSEDIIFTQNYMCFKIECCLMSSGKVLILFYLLII